MGKSRGKARWWLGRGMLVVGTVLFFGTVVEVYLRLTFEYKPNLSIYIQDFEVGKRLNPGFQGDHYGVPVSINSHGMRDREFTPEKPSGRRRAARRTRLRVN